VPTKLETETTKVLGLSTRHLVRGEGERTVLVLHGWGASIEAVYPIVSALSPVACVHALDLPGFGETAPPPRPWGVEDYQRFVAAYMDAAGIGQATGAATAGAADGVAAGGITIVAHSNGGRIAIRMAATEPERVARLALVDAAGIRPKRTLRWYRRVAMAKVGKQAARRLGRRGERLRDALVSRAASADYAAAGELRPTLVRLVNADLREYMPRIAAPTLLIWGADDAETPVAMARQMERLIPDAGLVVLEGAGHYSYLDQPARFARIVSHFIAPPDAAGGGAPGAVLGGTAGDAQEGAGGDAQGGKAGAARGGPAGDAQGGAAGAGVDGTPGAARGGTAGAGDGAARAPGDGAP
jgi:pimeloyl-ACP methyl ester carboxylesterase